MATEELELQNALRRLDAWQQDSPFSKQRRFRRHPVRGFAHLHPGSPQCADQPPVTANLRDISRGGVGMLCSHKAEMGTHWVVQLTDDRVTLATMPGFCRYCRSLGQELWLIGIEFGAQASILVALGVNAADLASGDRNEIITSASNPRQLDPASGNPMRRDDEFLDPAAIAA